jgi:glutamyl-tRNA synthetase
MDRIGWDRLDAALPALMERAKTLKDITAGAGFLLVARPLKLDEKAAKALDSEAKATLVALAVDLRAAGAWDGAGLEALLKAHAERTGKKLGQVAQPLRAALTGTTVSPPLGAMMAALGRDETLARIDDQVT